MHSQYITQSEPSADFDESDDRYWEEAFYKAVKNDHEANAGYEEDDVIHRRSTKWYRILTAVATISYEAAQSFVYSAAFLPTNKYDQGIGIASGYLVTPLCEAVNQLVSKNQDVRVILRAQHDIFDGNAVAGFAKIFAKHILSPAIPVVIAVYGTDDPVKDFEHSFIHAALHATLGYALYKLCSALANKKWPFKEIELKALSPKAQFVQDYIAAPILAGFPRMVLTAEFLRKTGLGIFKWIDNQDLHAPLVFGSSYLIYHAWRMRTREFRKVQPYIKLDKDEELSDYSMSKDEQIEVKTPLPEKLSDEFALPIKDTVNQAPILKKEKVDEQALSVDEIVDGQVLLAKASADDQVLGKSCSQKICDLAWASLKIAPVFIGGACVNYYLYSPMVGTTHDDDFLIERTKRDAFVAMGMYTSWLVIKATELATKKVLTSCYTSFFKKQNVLEHKGSLQESLLEKESSSFSPT